MVSDLLYGSYPSFVAVTVTVPTGTFLSVQPPAGPVVPVISVSAIATLTPAIASTPSVTLTLISTVSIVSTLSLSSNVEFTPLQCNPH